MSKPKLKITASLKTIEQIKELLPELATLQNKYELDVTISVVNPSKDQLYLESLLEHKHNSGQ